MNDLKGNNVLSFGIDLGGDSLKISKSIENTGKCYIQTVDNNLGKKQTPYNFLILYPRVLVVFDKEKSYIGIHATNNKVRCAPNYFTDINEMIAQNEERVFPFLQTSENKNMITLTCYELYAYYISQITTIIDPSHEVVKKEEKPPEMTFIPGIPIAFPDENSDPFKMSNFENGMPALPEASLDNIKSYECILAVPPYFNKNHISNIKSIYQKFLPRYHLQIKSVVPDYQALALCYGYENSITTEGEQLYVLLDMGYTHTSCSVVQYTSTQTNILSSRYTRQICGKKIDQLLCEYISRVIYGETHGSAGGISSKMEGKEELKESESKEEMKNEDGSIRKSGITPSTFSTFTPKIQAKIEDAMKDIKHKLSSEGSDTIKIRIDGALPNDTDYEGTYSVSLLNALLEQNEFPEILIKLVKEAIKGSKIGEDVPLGIIISGGCLRIPLLQNVLKEKYNISLINSLNMDESVSHGCSAYYLLKTRKWLNYSLIGTMGLPFTNPTFNEDTAEELFDEKIIDMVTQCFSIDEDDKTILTPQPLSEPQLAAIETRINEILNFEASRSEIAGLKNDVEKTIYEQPYQTDYHNKVLEFLKKPESNYLPNSFYIELRKHIMIGDEIPMERLLDELTTTRNLPSIDELADDCYLQIIEEQYKKVTEVSVNLPEAVYEPPDPEIDQILPLATPAYDPEEFKELIQSCRKSEIVAEKSVKELIKRKSIALNKATTPRSDSEIYSTNEDGKVVDSNGNLVDDKYKLNSNGDLVDANGNIVDKDGNPIPSSSRARASILASDIDVKNRNYHLNSKGELVDENGNVIDQSKYHLNENGELVDKDGNIVDAFGNIIVPTPITESKEEAIQKYHRNENGELVDEDGNIIDETKYHLNENGELEDADGNIVDSEGNIIRKAVKYHRNEKGELVDRDGNVIDESLYHLNKDGELVDKDGNIVDSQGNIIRKAKEGKYHRNENGELVDEEGNVIDESKYHLNENGELEDANGNIVDSHGNIIRTAKAGKYFRSEAGVLMDDEGHIIDESKYHLNEDGELVDEDGNVVDWAGNVIIKKANKSKLGKAKYHIDKDGNIVDEDGNIIDSSLYHLNENGELEDKDGNIVDKDGNILVPCSSKNKKNNVPFYRIDKDGNIVDEDGNVIDSNLYHLNNNGELEDEYGNIVDSHGNILRKSTYVKKHYRRNENGQLVDENGNVINEKLFYLTADGDLVDQDGNIVDADGNILRRARMGKYHRNENGELVDEDGNIVDENLYHLNANGELEDKDGNIVDAKGNIIRNRKFKQNQAGELLDEYGNVVDENGNIIRKSHLYHRNKDGQLEDEEGNIIDESKFHVNEDGELEDADGNIVDKDGNILRKSILKGRKSRYHRNERGELVDEHGNVIDETKYRLGNHGELLDKDGNQVDAFGNIIRKAKQGKYHRNEKGELVDENGKVIDETKYHLNENGELMDKDGNIVDADGNIIRTVEEEKKCELDPALRGIDFNYAFGTGELPEEEVYKPWSLTSGNRIPSPNQTFTDSRTSIYRGMNDPIQYLLTLAPTPALMEYISDIDCVLTKSRLEQFKCTTSVRPITPDLQMLKSLRPPESTLSPSKRRNTTDGSDNSNNSNRYHELQSVFYLDKEKKLYAPGLFLCYLENNYVQIAPDDKYKGDVVIESDFVRPYKTPFMPGCKVHFKKPYADLLERVVGCNEAEVLREREKRFTIEVGDNMYKRVHPGVFE